jgi:hypothetical protein
VTLTPRETTFVVPFYLKLMRTNATWVGEKVWEDLVVVGRTATLDDTSGCSELEPGVLS